MLRLSSSSFYASDKEDVMWLDYWPMPWVFPLFGIIFMIVCMTMMFMMMRGMHRRHGDALEILRERFARGETSEAEFEQRRRLLQA
jgi:uncharacterized membrane protein